MATTATSERPPVDREHALFLLREMLRIRRFEEKAAEMYSLQKIHGFLHLYIGEEATGVGTMQAFTPDDNIVATYREHGQALARGMSAKVLMAEMFGKATGCSRGHGGSMHFFDATRRFLAATQLSAADCPSPWAWRWRINSKNTRGLQPATLEMAQSPKGNFTNR